MKGRFALVWTAVLALAWIAACGLEPTEIPSEVSRSLDAAAKKACDDATVVGIIEEIYSNPGQETKATTQCANVFEAADKSSEKGVKAAFGFVDHVLADYQKGKLAQPGMGTLEEALTALFDALFAALGFEAPSIDPGADLAIGTVDETGGVVTVPSAHAALQFAPGDLADDTHVVLSLIPDPDPGTPGGCPFAFPVPYDCYPLFYSYSIFPESNLTGTPTLGQCVVEPPDPDAPPNATVEARLRIASEDENNPGTLVIWPFATAPATVDCSDLAMGPPDWRDEFWAALGPLGELFSVTPAYANPGKLGASVSTFSPFAPVDTLVTGSIAVLVEDDAGDPLPGATVDLEDLFATPIATQITGPSGTTTFGGLAFDDYEVTGSLAGYTTAVDTVTITSAMPSDTVLLELDATIF